MPDISFIPQRNYITKIKIGSKLDFSKQNTEKGKSVQCGTRTHNDEIVREHPNVPSII